MKKMAIARVLGFSACCAVLNSCGDGLPTVSGKNGGGGGGAPILSLQFDKKGDGSEWIDIPAGSNYKDRTGVMNLHASCGNFAGTNYDFKFRLVNTGTGNLTGAATAVTVTKTSDYTGILRGVPADFNFSMPSQPTLPAAAGTSTEFVVRLNNDPHGPCWLGAVDPEDGGGFGRETALVTVQTNDPTNPTYNATIFVFGGS